MTIKSARFEQLLLPKGTFHYGGGGNHTLKVQIHIASGAGAGKRLN